MKSGIALMRCLGVIAVAAGIVAVLASVATAAAPTREPEYPSYAIPNIAAIVMCLAAVAIACKHTRRT